MAEYKFPNGFLWGASTSSHQVEGGNHNNWSEWELANANRLARQADKTYSGWIPHWESVRPIANNPNNYMSGRACDHYHRFAEDFDLAKSFNHNSHRFSIEWSRVEPRQGEFDEAEIDHYRQVIGALKQRGLEPFVTLWHWTIPIWLRDQGGWESAQTAEHFKSYCAKMAQTFSEVKFWITLNEPDSYSALGYLVGDWPPQNRNPLAYYKVVRNLLNGHKLAYAAIKAIHPAAQIGIAKSNTYFESRGIINGWLKNIAKYLSNDFYLNPIKDHLDFVGLNYYFHNRIHYGFNRNQKQRMSDMGSELYPEGIYHVIIEAHKKYARPIYITENGLADADDNFRSWYIRETLKNIHQAMGEGADVRGYLHWSLLDNFEWDKGFWPRYGLVEVDYSTLERKPRKSAYDFAKIIKANGFSE